MPKKKQKKTKKKEVNRFGVVECFVCDANRKNIKPLNTEKFTDLVA